VGAAPHATVEVLGPIRVVDASGADITPAGALQRRLLALLVLRRDRVVSTDAAVEALWPDRRPRDATAALQNQVSRLRKALPGVDITAAGDGYALSSASLAVDVDTLSGLPVAREVDARAAVDAILERWQGPAYPELVDVDDGRIEAARLEELRVQLLEVRAERRLAEGAGADIVPELARLVDEHPMREQPVSLLMQALATAGRRVEALRAYDDFRRRLGDELGIDPSPMLGAQHDALLREGLPRSPTTSARFSGVTLRRLPVPATRLIGREALLREVEADVDAHRVVTLVGPGGVGKTRLVVELGHALQAGGERPVALCELNATAPEAVVERVAAELGIEPRAGSDLVERIVYVLDDDPLVLLLDGCEHALDPIAALVERLVARCPEVRVVVTSQERLRVRGEQVLRVPSLPSEDEEAAAVQLFVERARTAAPDVVISPSELTTVAEVARRLDGLPLAIELAAARLHTHELAEVAAGLDERFSLLSHGYRDSARHGSLRAAVSWSYDLLDERAQRLLAELSVFAGPFAAADATAVCDLDPPVRTDDLAQLVERSLLTRTDDRRYALLETLRAFGAEQLAASGATGAAHRRHAEHFAAWTEEADRRLLDGGRGPMAALEAAVPDLRAALDHLLADHRVDLAGQLVAPLRDFGFFGSRPDVLAWADRVVAADPEGKDPGAARVVAVSAYASWMVGDTAASVASSERALQLSQAASASPPTPVLALCGNSALITGRLEEAAQWYQQAMAAATAEGDVAQQQLVATTEVLGLAYSGDPRARDRADGLLATVADAETPYAAYAWYAAGEACLASDDECARGRLTRAMELAESTGAALVTGVAGASRASIDARVGDATAAVAEYRWLIPHWRRAGVWATQWTMLRSIARLLERLGHYHEAAVLEGAVRATVEGHPVFGADEEALGALSVALRRALGDDGYAAAHREGARLDGDAAADVALRALG
jgi:predicted ATPase/DNA-binding SARP family transcriptional activator